MHVMGYSSQQKGVACCGFEGPEGRVVSSLAVFSWADAPQLILMDDKASAGQAFPFAIGALVGTRGAGRLKPRRGTGAGWARHRNLKKQSP